MDPTAEAEFDISDLPESTAPILLAEPARVQAAVQMMQECVAGFAYPGESRTLVQLHMFAYAWEHPDTDPDSLKKELTRYNTEVLSEEAELAADTEFPSIGVEIEVSGKIIPFDTYIYGSIISKLMEMGFIFDYEMYSVEIKTPPSHSARVQARMILELQQLGLVPRGTDFFCSLHINLGLKTENWTRILGPESLSDVLTYAYVPAGRIRNRNYATVAYRNNDEEFKKIIPIKQGIELERWEFRTPRVNGRLTYRMLVEAQRVGSLLQNTTEEGKNLKKQFVEAVYNLRENYGLPANAPADHKDTAAKAVSNAWQVKKHNIQLRKQNPEAPLEPNLIDEARAIMHRFARKAYDLHMRQRQDNKARV